MEREISYHSVKVSEGGSTEVLTEGEFPMSKPIPTEPGEYQFRPAYKRLSVDVEHGAFIPIYDWQKGVIPPEEWLKTEELPESI